MYTSLHFSCGNVVKRQHKMLYKVLIAKEKQFAVYVSVLLQEN